MFTKNPKPKTMPSKCIHCDSDFTAKLANGGNSYGMYCPLCVSRKVWARNMSFGSKQ